MDVIETLKWLGVGISFCVWAYAMRLLIKFDTLMDLAIDVLQKM